MPPSFLNKRAIYGYQSVYLMIVTASLGTPYKAVSNVMLLCSLYSLNFSSTTLWTNDLHRAEAPFLCINDLLFLKENVERYDRKTCHCYIYVFCCEVTWDTTLHIFAGVLRVPNKQIPPRICTDEVFMFISLHPFLNIGEFNWSDKMSLQLLKNNGFKAPRNVFGSYTWIAVGWWGVRCYTFLLTYRMRSTNIYWKASVLINV